MVLKKKEVGCIKLNVKYKNIIFAFLMAFSMSTFITFVLVSLNTGYTQEFLSVWIKTWSQAFFCAFFGAYFFPIVIKQVMKKINFVENPLIIESDYLNEKTKR